MPATKAREQRIQLLEQNRREPYLIERALWDKDHPITPDHRVRVRAELSAPIVEDVSDFLCSRRRVRFCVRSGLHLVGLGHAGEQVIPFVTPLVRLERVRCQRARRGLSGASSPGREIYRDQLKLEREAAELDAALEKDVRENLY